MGHGAYMALVEENVRAIVGLLDASQLTKVVSRENNRSVIDLSKNIPKIIEGKIHYVAPSLHFCAF